MPRPAQEVIYPRHRRTPPKNRRRFPRYWWLSAVLAAVLGGRIAINFITIQGIPCTILLEVVLDDRARNDYFSGNKIAFHDRLQQLGIEEQIKAYYRPKIRDEETLDQYIHQVFYKITGYVGHAYFVNSQDKLVLKSYFDPKFERWFKLAKKVGVVVGRQRKHGTYYLINSQGAVASYSELAAVFPIAELEKLIKIQQLKP